MHARPAVPSVTGEPRSAARLPARRTGVFVWGTLGRGRALTPRHLPALHGAQGECVSPTSSAESGGYSGSRFDVVDGVGDMHSPRAPGTSCRDLAVSARPRLRRFTLGVQRANPRDFNALNFLDPIWSSLSPTARILDPPRRRERAHGQRPMRRRGAIEREALSAVLSACVRAGSNLASLVPVGPGTQIRRDVRADLATGGR